MKQRGSDHSAYQSNTEPPESLLGAYRQAVEGETLDWKAYQILGQYHLERGNPEQAAEIYQRYPPFAEAERSLDRNVDASFATSAGSEMFFRGYDGHARPLFEAAARLAPETAAGLTGRFHLAVLREEWSDAIDVAERRLQRCTGIDALRDAILILYGTGQSERAWALLDEATRQAGGSAFWSEALVGLRIENRSDESIVVWLTDEKHRESNIHVPSYAILALLQDRSVSDAWGDRLRDLYRAMLMSQPKTANLRLRDEQIEDHVRTASEANVRFVEAYADWKRGHFGPSWKHFLRALKPHQSTSPGPAWIQPYLAWSAIESGQNRALERHLERVAAEFNRMSFSSPAFDPRPAQFTTDLVSAVRAGLGGNPEAALALLRAALNRRAPSDRHILPTWYQTAELCEALYLATDHAGYRALLLELSRRHTRIQPMFAWSWAVVARYSNSADERQRALRAALHLDPRSAWLDNISRSNIAVAHRWLDTNHPFSTN